MTLLISLPFTPSAGQSGISSRTSPLLVTLKSFLIHATRGLFAADYIAALDGTKIPGGWINHNWIQLAHQAADSITGFSYSFGMTCVILFVMNLIPGLSLRASEEAEIQGIDEAELGEFAYDFV